MNIADFTSGRPEDRYRYKAFLPERICHEWVIADPELSELLGRADRALGELNAIAQLIPDIEFFIRMYVAKEAMHWELYTKVTSWLRIDFTGRRSGQRQRSSPCRCANPGRLVMFTPSAGRFSRAVALKLCCRDRKGNASPSCTVLLPRFHHERNARIEPCDFCI